MFHDRYLRWCLLILAVPFVQAQNALVPDPTNLPDTSVSEKWDFFVSETVTPLTLIATGFNATTSQLTRSAPLYGKHFGRNYAFAKRFGATLGDNVSQNFFGDFVLASAFHEDTRYRRLGPAHHMLPRLGYAISRAVVARTDSGDPTFNWANVMGCAMSAALSNAYYPAMSRTSGVAAVNWGTNVAGGGLTNLLPEFGPDMGHWIKRHLPHH
jgi:hypothetical protein